MDEINEKIAENFRALVREIDDVKARKDKTPVSKKSKDATPISGDFSLG